jgi:phospholipase/carboxylesterase
MNNTTIAAAGAPLRRAKAAMIMMHGRGGSAESMLEFAGVFAQPDIAYLAPQAPGSSWYPYSFMAPQHVLPTDRVRYVVLPNSW